MNTLFIFSVIKKVNLSTERSLKKKNLLQLIFRKLIVEDFLLNTSIKATREPKKAS